MTTSKINKVLVIGAAMILAALLVWVVLYLNAGATSTATWVVDRDERVDSETTGFTVVVTRVGCGSGVDGEPYAPAIEYTESEVRVTFRISPRIDSGTCEGTLGVPYEVELKEPLGDRSLVDGECQPGSTALATAFCLGEGVRYAPE